MDVFETGLTSAGFMTVILVIYRLSRNVNWSSSCRSRLVDDIEERVKEKVNDEIRKAVEDLHLNNATAPRIRGESKTDDEV